MAREPKKEAVVKGLENKASEASFKEPIFFLAKWGWGKWPTEFPSSSGQGVVMKGVIPWESSRRTEAEGNLHHLQAPLAPNTLVFMKLKASIR